MSIYVVFAVDAADRLTLLCPPVPGKAPELKQVALSFVQAPKLAKRSASGELGSDDPCGYEAMELIRSLCLGKQVRFADDFMIEPLQRMSGRLQFASGEDAAELLLSHGYCSIPDRIPPRMPKELFEKYSKIMGEAKLQKKGIFAANAKANVRKLVILDPTKAREVVATLQASGGEEKIRVERVLSGSSLIITIPSQGVQCQLVLAGIQCPLTSGKSELSDAVGVEAKFHTERLLLHRMTTVQFGGVDNFMNVVGSIVSPKGSFQEELLSKGLATIHGPTLNMCPVIESLRAAEKAAQEKRLGIWKDYSESKLVVNATTAESAGTVAIPAGGAGVELGAEVQFAGDRQFEGIVVQVVNSDTIVVRDLRTLANIKVSLAGLRTAKNVQRDHDGRSPETRVTYFDYSWEAKELLRTRFIGKKVSVFIDYVRMIPETKELRPMATVVDLTDKLNAGAAVIEAGFGTFFLGRNDMCAAAAELQQAEATARSRSVGTHSDKEAPQTKVVELSRLGDSKGKYYLSFLQRGMQGTRPPVWRGIVDVVLGGASFRVYIPKEHFQIPFKLAGVIAPSSAINPGDTADAFATESKDFAILSLQQREVELQVDTSDRAGNFIGNIQIVGGSNFAVQLVEAGLATVANAERLPYFAQLQAAEQKAKQQQKNIWSAGGSVPSRQVKLETQKAAANPDAYRALNEDWTPVVLADGQDSSTVFLQSNTPEAIEGRRAVQAALQQAAAGSGYAPSKNEMVCAYFKDDGTWNRAKVVNVYKDEGYAEVLFIDFGNRQEVKIRDLRPMPREGVLRDQPPAAISARLAFFKNRGDGAEYTDAAYDEVFAYCDGKTLYAKALYECQNKKYYLVSGSKSTPQSGDTLNEKLLASGVSVLDKHSQSVDASWFKALSKAQDVARKSRLRLWKFGDVDEDSDQD